MDTRHVHHPTLSPCTAPSPRYSSSQPSLFCLYHWSPFPSTLSPFPPSSRSHSSIAVFHYPTLARLVNYNPHSRLSPWSFHTSLCPLPRPSTPPSVPAPPASSCFCPLLSPPLSVPLLPAQLSFLSGTPQVPTPPTTFPFHTPPPTPTTQPHRHRTHFHHTLPPNLHYLSAFSAVSPTAPPDLTTLLDS